jgi:hypothetical protein
MKIKGLITLLLMMNAGFASNHLLFNFSGNYTWGSGNADFVKLKLTYHLHAAGIKEDSFTVNGPFSYEWRREFAAAVDSISFKIIDHTRRVPQTNTFAKNFINPYCSAYRFPGLLKKGTCEAFPMNELGTICASLTLKWFNDSQSHDPIAIGLNSQPQFHCEQEAMNVKLTAPCFFNPSFSDGKLKWYEAISPNGPWFAADTGMVFSPFASLKRQSAGVFNVRRYYKIMLDTFGVTGEKNKASSVFGPLNFYLNARKDSVNTSGRTCLENQKNIHVYFKKDSLHQSVFGVNIWLRKLNDTGNKLLWFLGNHRQVSQFNFNGKSGQFHPMAAVNAGKELHLINGLYAVGVDFTPWNDFDCGFCWDTVSLEGPYGFKLNTTFRDGESCPGKKDGKWLATAGSAKWNDTVLIGFKGFGVIRAGDSLTQLGRGKYPFTATNTGGCVVLDTLNIPGALPFGKKFRIDTVFCPGQSQFVDARDPNAAAFVRRSASSKIFTSDTFSLHESGLWFLEWTNDSGCVARDTIKVEQRNEQVKHDFLIPAQVRLSDTVLAIDHCLPKASTNSWFIFGKQYKKVTEEQNGIRALFLDTGRFLVVLRSRFSNGCGFVKEKQIQVISATDSARMDARMGYLGPNLIHAELRPNPSNGKDYKIKIRLRKAADVKLMLLDPISGKVLQSCSKINIQQMDEMPFSVAAKGVYYVRVQTANELKTLKMIVVD